MRQFRFLLFLSCVIGLAKVCAEDRQLDWQDGEVTVSSEVATITLPEGYRYLQQADARYVVEEMMHNPPDPTVVGLIAMQGEEHNADPFIAIVSYETDQGHIKDDDAATLDYDKLLTQMQDSAREHAAERRSQGYSAYELVGWAEAPHYEAATHKLYWAQNAKFEDQSGITLNYNVRLLGSKGVLVISAIGGATDLARLAEGSQTVLAATELNPGSRYDDFKPGIDKVAAYGIGGLIAGGVLAKAGFFAALGKIVLALLKPLIVGVCVAGGAVARALGIRKKRQDSQS